MYLHLEGDELKAIGLTHSRAPMDKSKLVNSNMFVG
jgi:hypothetical protein